MSRYYGLIPNFAEDQFCCCQPFQENVNHFRNDVNAFRKVSTYLVKRLSTISGK